jgi:hypothetical protein
MTHRYRRIFSFTALASVLLFTSCLFDTRDAHPPTTGTGGGCILDSPERAFVCMTQALENQLSGDYERSLSEHFVFTPTPADALDDNFTGTGVYDNWDKKKEMDVLRLLFDDSNLTIVDFGTPTRVQNQNTFVQWEVSYALKVVTVAAPTDTTIYKGVAHIDVKNENGNWRVTSWDEIETVSGFSTWGFLRGILGLRLNP